MKPCKHCGGSYGPVRCPDALAQIDAGTYTGVECCVMHYGCQANGGRGCAGMQGERRGYRFRAREEAARRAALTPKARAAEDAAERARRSREPAWIKLRQPVEVLPGMSVGLNFKDRS